MGDKFCYMAETADKAFQHFNGESNNKALIIVDETSSYQTSNLMDKIKSAITAEYREITYKGKDPIRIPNISHYVFITNNDNPLKIDMNDRRFMSISLDDKHCDNKNYWSEYHKELDNKEVRQSFYNYLKQYNPLKFDFKAERVETEYYRDIKSFSIPIYIIFINDLIQGDHLNKYSPTDLWNLFKKFCDEGNFKNHLTTSSFGVYIKRIEGVIYKKSTNRFYHLEEDKIKEFLSSKYNL